MPDTIALSESAVAVLRFRIKGLRVLIAERNRDAYRELATADIMEPVPGADGSPEAEYGFTEEGWAWRQEILDAAVARGPEGEIAESRRGLHSQGVGGGYC